MSRRKITDDMLLDAWEEIFDRRKRYYGRHDIGVSDSWKYETDKNGRLTNRLKDAEDLAEDLRDEIAALRIQRDDPKLGYKAALSQIANAFVQTEFTLKQARAFKKHASAEMWEDLGLDEGETLSTFELMREVGGDGIDMGSLLSSMNEKLKKDGVTSGKERAKMISFTVFGS